MQAFHYDEPMILLWDELERKLVIEGREDGDINERILFATRFILKKTWREKHPDKNYFEIAKYLFEDDREGIDGFDMRSRYSTLQYRPIEDDMFSMGNEGFFQSFLGFSEDFFNKSPYDGWKALKDVLNDIPVSCQRKFPLSGEDIDAFKMVFFHGLRMLRRQGAYFWVESTRYLKGVRYFPVRAEALSMFHRAINALSQDKKNTMCV